MLGSSMLLRLVLARKTRAFPTRMMCPKHVRNVEFSSKPRAKHLLMEAMIEKTRAFWHTDLQKRMRNVEFSSKPRAKHILLEAMSSNIRVLKASRAQCELPGLNLSLQGSI